MKQKDTVLQTIKVPDNSELLAFLLENKVRKSRNAIKSLLVNKQVRVNHKLVSQYDYKLKPGDIVTIHNPDHRRDNKHLDGVTVVYEDEYLVVVDKVAGLLSIATDREKSRTAYSIVSSYLKIQDKNARIFVLHRLDRETSGLMIYAKSTEVQETMQRNWDNLVQIRSYIAVAEGKISPQDGTITTWLTEDKNFVMHSNDFDNGGQKAVTHYKTLETNRRYSKLSLDLETGRKNQIRVHMQHIGHPIVGDKKYGSKINPIKRVALHANELVFIHPVSGVKLEFQSVLPKKMQIFFDLDEEGNSKI